MTQSSSPWTIARWTLSSRARAAVTSATGARTVQDAQRTGPPHARSTAAKLPPRSRVKSPELSLSATSASASVHVPKARRAFVSPEEYPIQAWGVEPQEAPGQLGVELAERRGAPELLEDRRLAGVVLEGPGERAGKPPAAARERVGEPRAAARGGRVPCRDRPRRPRRRRRRGRRSPAARGSGSPGPAGAPVSRCDRARARTLSKEPSEATRTRRATRVLAEPLAAGPERVDHRRAIGSREAAQPRGVVLGAARMPFGLRELDPRAIRNPDASHAGGGPDGSQGLPPGSLRWWRLRAAAATWTRSDAAWECPKRGTRLTGVSPTRSRGRSGSPRASISPPSSRCFASSSPRSARRPGRRPARHPPAA